MTYFQAGKVARFDPGTKTFKRKLTVDANNGQGKIGKVVGR